MLANLFNLERFAQRPKQTSWSIRLLMGIAAVLLTCLIAVAAFLLHFDLSAVGSLHLLLVVLVALHWGFAEATVISVTSVACLDYLFTSPVFTFSVYRAQDWISLATFEAAALLVSRLSSKVRLHATQSEVERTRTATLYELSRAVLLIDTRHAVIDQLAELIRELLKAEAVDLWTLSDIAQAAATDELRPGRPSHEQGLERSDRDDEGAKISRRVLRLGTTPIGMMVVQGWEIDALLADAVASLAALALERARALQKENRAEAARTTEQLRTAVLDGLAHGFKTPLTAIQTASSGLLAIGQLSETQVELVSIIDEEATMLTRLTTRLLQTAALDAQQVRLRRSELSLPALLRRVIEQQSQENSFRLTLVAPDDVGLVEVDEQLVASAVLQLIDNALKYSSVGSMIVVAVSQNAYETRISVRNPGSSVRAEESERVFERFYRSADTAHGPAGTGLGLSIVKRTAEAHGGTVMVSSEEGETTFSFTLQHHKGARNG